MVFATLVLLATACVRLERGPAIALGAVVGAVLYGVAIVVGNFLLAGAMLSVAARISLGLYHAAALLGFILRLGLIAITMLAVAALIDVDRMALGITVVAAYLVLLSWEAVAMTKGSERELEWTS